jgi:hypothetical protein
MKFSKGEKVLVIHWTGAVVMGEITNISEKDFRNIEILEMLRRGDKKFLHALEQGHTARIPIGRRESDIIYIYSLEKERHKLVQMILEGYSGI